MSRIRPANDVSLESLLGQVADEFTERLADGAQPDVEEYARRYPALADVIREVFPALQAIHPQKGDRSGGSGGQHEVTSERLGDYRIVREIGRGGMGIVYEAEQDSLRRRVALKVLPFAAVLDPRQLQRFKNEAQAAANLHHPNIVPVFALGCERGVHYYAMQYIEGRPLSTVIRELRDLAGVGPGPRESVSSVVPDPSSRLGLGSKASFVPGMLASSEITLSPQSVSAVSSLSEQFGGQAEPGRSFFHAIARLGVQAAEALQYAHDHGVIHRDIKPSNLLLDAGGRLWITDFGLALMHTGTGLTMPGDLLGTIRYMSPEQALAKRIPIDQRSDVYSLGVTLYELLSLRPAFDGDDRQELLRQIAFDEPRLLRRLNHSIPKELETIVAKAMAKRPDDRYWTAQDLADDLGRFLEDRPILARPPGPVDRVAKWSRRHRAVVAAAVLTLVMAVAGLSVTTVLVARASREAVWQMEQAEAERARAEDNLRRARDAVDRMLAWLATQDVSGIPQMDKLRRGLVEDLLESHQQIVKLGTSAAVQSDTARTYRTIADLQALLGQDREAEESYRKAIGLFEEPAGSAADRQAQRVDLVDSYLSLATFLWERRRFVDSDVPAGKALALTQDLVRQSSDQSEEYAASLSPRLARALGLSALIRRDTGGLREAEKLLREAVSLRRVLIARRPQQPEHRLELARSLRNLGDVLMKLSQEGPARQCVGEALALQGQLALEFADRREYKIEQDHTQRWWDEVLRVNGLAGATSQPADASTPPFGSPDAGVPMAFAYQDALTQAFSSLSTALRRTGDPEGSEQAYHQAVERQKELIRRFPDERQYRAHLVNIHWTYASAMAADWRVKQAEEAYAEALSLQQEFIERHPGDQESLRRVKLLQAEQLRLEDLKEVDSLIAASRASAEGVAQTVQRVLSADVEDMKLKPFSRLVFAEFLLLGDATRRAVPQLQQVIREGYAPSSTYKSLGWALLACGRKQEAREAFEHALEGRQVDSKAEHPLTGWCPDPCTAAYFLDLVTEEQYVSHWNQGHVFFSRYAPYPWFYVGQRMEIEGRLNEARRAYSEAVELGKLPGAHHTAHWAEYRLSKLPQGSLSAAK